MAPIRCCFDQTAVWHSDAARGPSTPSFDHLLSAGDQHRRHSQAEPPGSLEVDEEVKPGRLLDWQVGGLGPLENPSGVDAGLAIGIRQASAVTHETARFREVNKRVDARDSIAGGQGHDLVASSDEESISTDHDRVSASLSQARESCIDFV